MATTLAKGRVRGKSAPLPAAAARSAGRGRGRGRGERGRARPGGVQVSEVQRARVLRSAVQVVSEYGYQGMSVARVADRAHVSRRTFYDVFEGREDCFLAAFQDGVARARALVVDAYERESGGVWRESVRAGLCALLVFLDEEPGMGSLLVVDALRAGPRVLRARAEILEQLGRVIQEDGSRGSGARELPSLTGEGVVGAVFSVIHTRLQSSRSGSLVGLLNQLMAIVVLSYQGPVAARREQAQPLPTRSAERDGVRPPGGVFNGMLQVSIPAGMRLTYRTMRVLSAIGEHPGSSNREIGELAGASDQGQISKLLLRLEKLGLVENATEHERSRRPSGEPNAWCLTPSGREIWQTVIVSTSRDGSS
jgi:AcrR family transcriptional regulator/DNA-binding MarR family transcriptional regulator